MTDTLAHLVELDIRNEATDEQARFLRAPENVDEWYAALVATAQDVDGQLSSRRAELNDFQNECQAAPNGKQAYFDAKADHDLWRSGALHFKRGVSERLREAKSLRKDKNKDAGRDSSSWHQEMNRTLVEIRDLLREVRNELTDR